MYTSKQHETAILARAVHYYWQQRYWHKSDEWFITRGGHAWRQYIDAKTERKIFICRRALGCQFHDAEVISLR